MIVGVGAAAAIAMGSWARRKSLVRETAVVDAASPRGPAGPVMRLTTGSDLNLEPTVSPDGEWVAYASDRSGEGNLDIWMQRLSGGEAVRLTRDAADEREPTFSADGSRIAFRSEREGGGIYVMPAHSGGEARLLVPERAWPALLAGRSMARVFEGSRAVQHGQSAGVHRHRRTSSRQPAENRRDVLPDFVSVACPSGLPTAVVFW